MLVHSCEGIGDKIDMFYLTGPIGSVFLFFNFSPGWKKGLHDKWTKDEVEFDSDEETPDLP